METETKDKGLESFTWDEEENIDFFGISKSEEEVVLTDEEIQQIKSEKEKPEKAPVKEEKKKKEEVEVEEEHVFFEENQEDDSNSGTSNEKFFNVLAKGMKEKGVLASVEIPEDELDEETFVNLYETEVDNRVNETFEAFFEELDEDAKSFLKFKKDGGSTQQFFNILKETTELPKGDLEDEAYQKKIARFYFKNIEQIDEEDIDDKLTWLEDSDKLEKYSKKYLTLIEKAKQQKLENINKAKQAEIDAASESNKKFVKIIKDTLSEVDSIKDIKITANDKKELLPFITESTVKIGKNKYMTGLQNALKDVMNDQKKLVLLAKLLKNDFDISSIERKIESKKTIELKQALEKTSKNSRPSGQSSKPKKSLSEFFN